MKVTILGNCQVGTLADSIELLMVGAEVQRELVSNDPEVLGMELRKYATSAEGPLLVHDSVKNIIDVNEDLHGLLPQHTIVVPTITFAAFHPDIQYGFTDGRIVKNGLDSDWNSRILLWAYLHGLSQSDARPLFCDEVFRALGYLDEWAASGDSLRQTFEKYGLKYGRWIRSVQRDGVFMYGINHPLPIALSSLASQIVERELPNDSLHVEDVHHYVTDFLSHIVWPVYPEIADELGIEGSYRWRVGRKYAQLDEFIDLCYESWDSIDLKKLDVQFIPTISERDNVVLLEMSGREK